MWRPLGWPSLGRMETKPLLRTNQQPDQPRTNTDTRLARQQHEDLYYSSISYKWRHRKGAKDPRPDFTDGYYVSEMEKQNPLDGNDSGLQRRRKYQSTEKYRNKAVQVKHRWDRDREKQSDRELGNNFK